MCPTVSPFCPAGIETQALLTPPWLVLYSASVLVCSFFFHSNIPPFRDILFGALRIVFLTLNFFFPRKEKKPSTFIRVTESEILCGDSYHNLDTFQRPFLAYLLNYREKDEKLHVRQNISTCKQIRLTWLFSSSSKAQDSLLSPTACLTTFCYVTLLDELRCSPRSVFEWVTEYLPKGLKNPVIDSQGVTLSLLLSHQSLEHR